VAACPRETCPFCRDIHLAADEVACAGCLRDVMAQVRRRREASVRCLPLDDEGARDPRGRPRRWRSDEARLAAGRDAWRHLREAGVFSDAGPEWKRVIEHALKAR